jgi:hypothetical protein
MLALSDASLEQEGCRVGPEDAGWPVHPCGSKCGYEGLKAAQVLADVASFSLRVVAVILTENDRDGSKILKCVKP